MLFHVSLCLAMEETKTILCDMYNSLPETKKKDVCLFLNRHRGNLLIFGGIRGDCPLEIGCKRKICGFCTCICQDPCLETLKLFVNQLQTVSYNMDQRKDRLAFVNHLDECGANILFKK